MYLKKLTLNGFKSFAEPAALTFSKGVSAIVGPNGSGKSNITDAIRWVLGEQNTRTLRGRKMEDIIFSGTARKKALSAAEVTLILDNTDGSIENQPDEIAVTRRLYRSGESEYRLNQKDCRLKDIHELFMDTGLGKNGYSLISQGGIENIINATPMELRSIVEEAVGIVSCKTRKHEAELKLSRTQDNIDRLNDILEEIEHQMKPLKRQSEKARVYLDVYETLKQVELLLFLEQMQQAEDQLKEGLGELKDLKFEIFDIEKKNKAQDFRFQQIKNRLRMLEEERQGLLQVQEDLKERLQASEREQLITIEKISHARDNDSRLVREAEALQADRVRLDQELTDLAQKEHTLLEALSQKEAAVESLSQEKEHCQAVIDCEKERQSEALKRKAGSEKQREALRAEIIRQREALVALETRKKLIEEQIGELAADCAREEQQAADQKAQRAAKNQEQARLIEAFNLAQQRLETHLKKQQQLQQTLQVAENNLQVALSKQDYLKKIQKNYSDYFPAIRKIMASRAHLGKVADAVYGPVGELVTVPEAYTLAIEVALGTKSQNIVVEDVQAASHCIEILKKERAGRATFLPMDRLRYRSLSVQEKNALHQTPGFLGLAVDLVTYDLKFQSVMESLLGRIAVVRDFQAARGLQIGAGKSCTIVTLSGEIFYPGGAIVGGYERKGRQSPISKKAEIEKLAAQIKQGQDEITQLHQEIEKARKTQRTLQAEQQQAAEILKEAEQDSWKLQKSGEDAEERLQKAFGRLEAARSACLDFQKNREALEGTIEEKQQKLKGFEAELSEAFEYDSKRLEDSRMQAETLSRQLLEVKINLARDQENVRALREQMDRIREQRDQILAKSDQLQEALAASRQDQTLKESFCDQLKVRMAQDRKALQETDDQLVLLARQLEEGKKESEGLEDTIRLLNHDLILKNEAKSRIEMAKSRLEIQMEHWESQIQDTYGMNLLMARDFCEKISVEGIEVTPENQRRLKNQMLDLGPVNVQSIEAYTALNERYTFMSAQIQDLIQGKQELETIIGTLDQSMEAQFREKFAVLQETFSRVFSVLFEGGEAQIVCTSPECILESGIELVAQPPGKHLRQLSLLSGGEKSMIAIALLFAFIELNPSPFCVIDEIDAALDDQNISRFTRYLEKVAADNQFIIITHRKSTLEACDAVYGVSMADSGVSRLVSVRLSDYAEPASETGVFK